MLLEIRTLQDNLWSLIRCFWFEKINTWHSLNTFLPQIWQYSNVLAIISQYCLFDPLSHMRWWSYRWSYHWVVDDRKIFKWSRDLVAIWPPCLVLVSLPSVTEATCLLLDHIPLNTHVRPSGPTCDVCCLGQSWEKMKKGFLGLGSKSKTTLKSAIIGVPLSGPKSDEYHQNWEHHSS